MLKVISYKDIGNCSDLFFGQHKLRHQEFIERQNYDVKTLDGMEFDEYDTLASIYLVYSEDQKTVLGCSRLTPIEYGCMLKDHFPDLVDDQTIFERPKVWEGTRFCIDRHLSADRRKIVLQTLALGYVEFGLQAGIDCIIGLMPTLILRSVFERNGVRLTRLGETHHIGQHSKIQAAAIAVDSDQIQRVFERTGLKDVLGADPYASQSHVA